MTYLDELSRHYSEKENPLHKFVKGYADAALFHAEGTTLNPDTHADLHDTLTKFHGGLPKHLQDSINSDPENAGKSVFLSRNEGAGYAKPSYKQHHDALHKAAKALGSHELESGDFH